ncbi:MAG: tRNA 4-thiouridine(8) synthase ThiI [Kiritimatiellia bacterium]
MREDDMSCKGLSLMSGGLDSQLAVRVLQGAGATVEAVCFSTPFFDISAAKRAADALGVKLHIIDFTDDEIGLLEHPPHGFGSAMNPCIDCHALMIRRAGELMERLGYDFVATGEVQGQRPMSQNRQALGVVEQCSGLKGRLVRPLSARLLEPTIPELEGKLDREKLLDLSGRGRERQIALAAEFGIVDYPSPAGGCKLTEVGFCRKLRDLKDHEGLGNRRLVELLPVGRRFRLPGGTSVILGRDRLENAVLSGEKGLVVAPVNAPGPTALLPVVGDAADVALARALVCAYSRHERLDGDIRLNDGEVVARPYSRERFKPYQIC